MSSDSFRLPIDIEAFVRDNLKPTSSGGGTLVGTHGDMLYQGPTSLRAVPATLGSGFMVMVSRGEGFAPEMIDLQALILALTGALNVARVAVFSVAFPILVGSGAASTAAGGSGSKSQPVVLPALAGSGSVTVVGRSTNSKAQAVVLPALSGSGTVIPP